MIRRLIFFIFLIFASPVNSNTFSEVFGSEGAAGIENPKTRSLSYTLQYATLAGSLGYVVKKLHDSGFLEPFGFEPNTFKSLSPLAYKKNFLVDKHSANIIGVSEKVDKLNYLNKLKIELSKKRFSSSAIEYRNNRNLSNSLKNFENRILVLERYYDKN